MPWIAWTPLLRGARNAGRELRQYTVPLCLGVRDPGIAELRSIRVARGVSEPESPDSQDTAYKLQRKTGTRNCGFIK